MWSRGTYLAPLIPPSAGSLTSPLPPDFLSLVPPIPSIPGSSFCLLVPSACAPPEKGEKLGGKGRELRVQPSRAGPDWSVWPRCPGHLQGFVLPGESRGFQLRSEEDGIGKLDMDVSVHSRLRPQHSIQGSCCLSRKVMVDE